MSDYRIDEHRVDDVDVALTEHLDDGQSVGPTETALEFIGGVDLDADRERVSDMPSDPVDHRKQRPRPRFDRTAVGVTPAVEQR